MSQRPWTGVSRKITTSSKLAEVDDACWVLYASLLVVMDSFGSIDARPHIVLATAWPLRGKTVAETERCIRELERVGLLVRHAEAGDEWLQMPDWDEPGKAGSMIRDRVAPQFGAEAKRRAAQKLAEREERAAKRKGPRRTAAAPPSTSEVTPRQRSASPEAPLGSTVSDLSSLAAADAGSPRVSHAREVAAAEPSELSRVAREQLGMHPSLDRPAMHAAAIRWEAHLRASCPKGVWPASTWAKNLTTWERWGMDAAIVAIDTAIGSNSWTPYQPRHGEAPAPSAKPAPTTAESNARADSELRIRQIERLWEDSNRVERETPTVGGGTVRRLVLERRYPGPEAAERELRDAGVWPPTNGHARPANAGVRA